MVSALTVTAVVVHYHGGTVFERCVQSCLGAGLEVVVVDNGGLGPGWARPGTRVLRMRRNRGYGAAANAGLAAVDGGPALVLNQDVEVTGEAVTHLVAIGTEARAWIIGPRLRGPVGVAAAKDRFPPPLAWMPPATSVDGAIAVPWVSGAAMLFLAGHTDLRFDERLFMYAEDEELCFRAWQLGGTVMLVEDAEMWHTGGTATEARWSRRAVTGRTVRNRARMVLWHAGWRGLPTYAGSLLRAR